MHLPPAAARDLLQQVSRARELLVRLQQLEQDLQRISDQEAGFLGTLNEVLASTSSAASANPIADLDRVVAALRSAEQSAKEIEVLDARIHEKELQLDNIRTELEEVNQEIARLGGTESEEEINKSRFFGWAPPNIGHRCESIRHLTTSGMAFEEHCYHTREPEGTPLGL